VQGYLICKPLPAAEIEQWLQQAGPFKLRSAW
jgi:EAL domain-containing protein (putative c-di-GMP-specific phosphodiesterase class I)